MSGPRPIIPVDLHTHKSNYYILRSFQQVWTCGNLIHIRTFCPALDTVAAGDHYFDWHPDGLEQPPIISVLFSIHPAFDFDTQVVISHSSNFDGTSIFILGALPPRYVELLLSRLLWKEVKIVESVSLGLGLCSNR